MQVLFATSNPHKVAEANLVGKRYDIKFVQVRAPYPEVRAESVADVARAGAEYVFERLGKEVIVEDTGLYIDALKGFPGAYSAFVYKKVGCEGVLRLLLGFERNARFISSIGFCSEKECKVFTGKVEGAISEDMRGEGGFGYDPIFVPGKGSKSFAEDPALKARVSHRTRAFESFCKYLMEE